MGVLGPKVAGNWAVVRPDLQPSIRDVCYKAYPNHPKGCPNYGKRDQCPPKVLLLDQVYDMGKPIYAIWNRYPFGEHVEKMRQKHPDWSQRQLECCLYWQGTARKQLNGLVDQFLAEHPGLSVTLCPEAMGVVLTTTMRQVGIELEWPPRTCTYQIALGGTRNG